MVGKNSSRLKGRTSPFPERPPRFLRTLSYEYRFTDLHEKEVTGKWWKRNYLGFYSQPFSINLEDKAE
ncbi:hypothetical protein PHSC3_000095 [Chlamydiales bacterium STE3]|nr:hypothetical protein PHSC3_000095 [Chlamydiales bacterium STE3]